jgi:hypothetical protein
MGLWGQTCGCLGDLICGRPTVQQAETSNVCEVGASIAHVGLGVASDCNEVLVDSWVASVHTSYEVVHGGVAVAPAMVAPMMATAASVSVSMLSSTPGPCSSSMGYTPMCCGSPYPGTPYSLDATWPHQVGGWWMASRSTPESGEPCHLRCWCMRHRQTT